ncbi:MAG: LamG-like jellyroll fold domain-containing protein [Myxococcota bacterium]
MRVGWPVALCLVLGGCARENPSYDAGAVPTTTDGTPPVTSGMGSDGVTSSSPPVDTQSPPVSDSGSLDTEDSGPNLSEGPCPTYFADFDEDGWGSDADALETCDPPQGYVEQGGDCDDDDPRVFPGRLRCDTKSPSLFAWYRLDGDEEYVADDSHYGNPAAPGSTTPAQVIDGAFREARGFGFGTRLLRVHDMLSALGTQPGDVLRQGTLAAWLRIENPALACASEFCLVPAVHFADESGNGFGFEPEVHIHAARGKFSIGFEWEGWITTAGEGAGAGCWATGPTIMYDEWTHVAFVWDEQGDGSTECALFVNGQLAGDDYSPAPVLREPLWRAGGIGGIANDISDVLSFPGSIDEVMFFTERRSPTDIQLDCGLDRCFE